MQIPLSRYKTTLKQQLNSKKKKKKKNDRQENNTAQPKADKCPSSISHFSPFSSCLTSDCCVA